MGILDRIILTIYTFLLTVLSLGVILLSLRLIPLKWVWTSIDQIYGHWEAGLIGAVFFLVSVRLLLAGVRSQRSRHAILHHTDLGDVHISIHSIENLVEKTARHTRGIRNVNVAVGYGKQGLEVDIKAVVSPDSNIPAVTRELQQRIYDAIKNTVGVDTVDIRINVKNISNDFRSRHRVE